MYRALYRKWRPQTFSDVVGQQHITQTLENELIAGKLAHAYLFTGSRGTGKTSCAKILAKAVNCENPVNGNPCNECDICRGIDSGAITDVLEIDAASNNGVDNIRDLREEANYTPVRAKFRVYIIDEVHMLSTGAFNALLKTLEEPPEHVKFILATTEVHKLPATILSRCQRFDFKRIEPEDIANRIDIVAAGEGFTVQRDAAMLIARVADGALRDALSLLDQCAGQSDDISAELVGNVAGLTGRTHLFELADCIRSQDCARALTVINELHNASCDMERLCTQLIDHYRNLMIIRSVKNSAKLIICTAAELERLEEQANGYTLENILYVLNILESAAADLRRGANGRVETEMAFVKLCSPNTDTSTAALLKRIAALEAALRSGVTVAPQQTSAEQPQAQATSEAQPQPAQAPALPDGELDCWQEIVRELKTVNLPLASMLMDSGARIQGEHLVLCTANASIGSLLKVGNNMQDLKGAIRSITGKNYKLGLERLSQQQAPQEPLVDPLSQLLQTAKANGIEIKTE